MEELFKQLTRYFATGVEASAGIIIGLASIEATFRAIMLFFVRGMIRRRARRGVEVVRPSEKESMPPQASEVKAQPARPISVPEDEGHQSEEDIRLRMGRWLAVALEFELAADILRTAVAPTWNEIGQLAAIVILRTVLNYFLQKEIDKAVVRSRPA